MDFITNFVAFEIKHLINFELLVFQNKFIQRKVIIFIKYINTRLESRPLNVIFDKSTKLFYLEKLLSIFIIVLL